MKHWSHLLAKLNACNEAIWHCHQFKTPAAAWRALDPKKGEAEAWVYWLTCELSGETSWITRRSFYGVTNKFVNMDLKIGHKLDLRPFVPVPTVDDLRRRVRGDFPWLLEES